MKTLLTILARGFRLVLTRMRLPVVPAIVCGIYFASPILGTANRAVTAVRSHLASAAESLATLVRPVPKAVPVVPNIELDTEARPVGYRPVSASVGRPMGSLPAGHRPAVSGSALPIVEIGSGPDAPSRDGEGRFVLTGKLLEKAGGRRIQHLISGILPAVSEVESNGRAGLIGDRHLTQMAYGQLQVRQPVCDDIASFYGVSINPTDCLNDWRLSELAFRLYVGFWLKNYEKETGKTATAEVACRNWNGGPTGYRKVSTEGYWVKIQRADAALATLVASL